MALKQTFKIRIILETGAGKLTQELFVQDNGVGARPLSNGTNKGALTSVLGKANGEWRFLYFLLEQIFFVQEQNYGCVGEPFVITYRIE